MDMETGLQKTLKLLKKHEGFRDTVYLDGNGIPTIGYGFTDPELVKKGKITQKEADARLTKEIATRYKTLKDTLPNFEKLSDDSKAALISYHFNYPAGFKDTTKFMKYWNAGDYQKAINEVDAGMNDPKNPGLRTRRLEEQALLRKDPMLVGITSSTKDGNKTLRFPVPEKNEYKSTWEPYRPAKTIYPLNNTIPESISSLSGADAPNATPRLKDF
jgi:GH24 family phage-related lysozyme (muramidase)